MSASTRHLTSQKAIVAQLAMLFSQAIRFFTEGERTQDQTANLERALQLYKQDNLGRAQALDEFPESRLEAFRGMLEDYNQQVVTSLVFQGMGRRAQNFLERVGIATLPALLTTTAPKLLKYRQCGDGVIGSIETTLATFGLRLGMTEEEIHERIPEVRHMHLAKLPRFHGPQR